ncbi:hypothetical protein C0J52_26683, partial [Blattella germanica]
EKKFTVFEEVQGGCRRIDIIAFKNGDSHGYIVDPTVRFEHHKGELSSTVEIMDFTEEVIATPQDIAEVAFKMNHD